MRRIDTAVSLTFVGFDDTLPYMSEQGNTLLYALTAHLGRSPKSVGVGRYSAQMKSTGVFGDAELQEALAEASGAKVEFIRYLEELRRGIIENALRDGKRVFVKGIAVVSGLRGSFSSVDGPFDPKKHKLAVTSYTYGDFQDCLKGTVPENTVKGGTPTLSRINEAGQDDEVIVGEDELTITGRDLSPEVSAADEGVFLVSLKTGERVATAEVSSSSLVEVVCRFAELPSAGRYRLVVATRCALGGEYRVVEAGREIEVK